MADLAPKTTCGNDSFMGCLYDQPCPEHVQRGWAGGHLVRQLHKAVYGATWARSDPPGTVWDILLSEVKALAASKQEGPDDA